MAGSLECEFVFVPWRGERRLHLYCLSMLAVVCLVGSQRAYSQAMDISAEPSAPPPNTVVETDTPLSTSSIMTTKTTGAPKSAPGKQPVESEIAVTGMIPAGDYRLFSATVRCTAWTVGVEYDRNSWGHLLKSRVDYVVEFLPLVLLSQPAISDFWGNARSPNQQLVYGVSLSPFGFRFLWRSDKAVRPFVIGKLGTAVFTQKALSPAASYANFNVQAAFGLQIRMTDRVDLRVEPFEFFHVSNGYLAASNPGMDQLATRIGISYRLGRQVQER
jgi:Lipid A 3-O-deacylase (PagL)